MKDRGTHELSHSFFNQKFQRQTTQSLSHWTKWDSERKQHACLCLLTVILKYTLNFDTRIHIPIQSRSRESCFQKRRVLQLEFHSIFPFLVLLSRFILFRQQPASFSYVLYHLFHCRVNHFLVSRCLRENFLLFYIFVRKGSSLSCVFILAHHLFRLSFSKKKADHWGSCRKESSNSLKKGIGLEAVKRRRKKLVTREEDSTTTTTTTT